MNPTNKKLHDLGQSLWLDNITRDFAEYEALLIIKQVTGNWPIESDRIVGATYACKPDGAMWRCIARAKVCKG